MASRAKPRVAHFLDVCLQVDGCMEETGSGSFGSNEMCLKHDGSKKAKDWREAELGRSVSKHCKHEDLSLNP